MATMIEPGLWDHVPSPFCGLGLDDLKIRVQADRVEVLENGDAVTKPAFEQPLGDVRPCIQGKPASLEEAIHQAATILSQAELPLIAGLATDVAGMREAVLLAERLGAIMDGINSAAALRNILALQESGWITTTLGEVRNRADLLVALGVDIEALFPRFFERHLWVDGMFVEAACREVVYVGKPPQRPWPESPNRRQPTVLACNEEALPEVVAVLRALVNDRPLRVASVGGICIAELKALADKLRDASYSVIAWTAGALNWPQAELTVQMVCEMIQDLNRTTRCAGLPLGGKEGEQTATQVCAWLTGFPTRVSFSRGVPVYDPYLHASDRLLADGEVDALLWISAYNVTRTPPACKVPTIVLGRCGMQFEHPPKVYIPVGVPGIDHAGHTYRMDNVVAIRLCKLRDIGLPSTAQVLHSIYQALESIAC